MLGTAAVAGVAAATNSQAGTVQITLSGERVTSFTAGGTFTGDLTGDGVVDVPNWNANTNIFFTSSIPGTTNYFQFVNAASFFVSAGRFALAARRFRATSGGSTVSVNYYAIANAATAVGTAPLSVSGLVPITFQDSRINGGATTNAFADIRAFNIATNTHAVEVSRTVFDDASTTAPTDAVPGGTNPEFSLPETTDPSVVAQRSVLIRKIKKLKKKIKAAKRAGNTAKAAKLKAKLKKLKGQLSALG